MKYTFAPEHIVIDDLFGSNRTYTIPEYQRPYSWDSKGKSERNNQVNVMWNDLYGYFKDGEEGEYFLGSMVMIETDSKKGSRKYDVIDGQQRLITIVLLFSAIKCFLKKVLSDDLLEVDSEDEKSQFIKVIENGIGTVDATIFHENIFGLSKEKKVRIEKNAEYEYDRVLMRVLECRALDDSEFEDANSEQKEVIQRYFQNRQYFEDEIRNEFVSNGKFTPDAFQKLYNFASFLRTQISIVRITATNFEVAYQVFEILNNRGLPLANKDLLRNFIIKEFDKIKDQSQQSVTPVEKWMTLENEFFIENEFISRWVESKTASKQKYSAFNDLKNIFERSYTGKFGKAPIELLYSDIEEDLGYYRAIVSPEYLDDSTLRNKLKFLLQAGNTRYTINLLMALFRSFKFSNEPSNSSITEFISLYEQRLIFTLLAPSKRFSGDKVFGTIRRLNERKKSEARNHIELEDSEKTELVEFLGGPVYDNKTAKLLIAKYIWTVEEDYADDNAKVILDYDKSTLEHIIPQNPAPHSNWLNDFSDDFRREFTYRLGNMTLLTSRLNSSAKNREWAYKRSRYQKTQLPITRDLLQHSSLKTEVFEQRQKMIVPKIVENIGL